MKYRHIATGEVVRLVRETTRGFMLVDANGNRVYATKDEFKTEYRAVGGRG